MDIRVERNFLTHVERIPLGSVGKGKSFVAINGRIGIMINPEHSGVVKNNHNTCMVLLENHDGVMELMSGLDRDLKVELYEIKIVAVGYAPKKGE